MFAAMRWCRPLTWWLLVLAAARAAWTEQWSADHAAPYYFDTANGDSCAHPLCTTQRTAHLDPPHSARALPHTC